MKKYEVKYHILGRNCCGKRGKPFQTIIIPAKDPEHARVEARKIIPRAIFKSIREATE